MPIELSVKKTIAVEEGRHNFEITELRERTAPHHYVDVFFLLKDCLITIKDGYPAHITENSKLGRLLKTFGVNIAVDTKVELESALIGRTGSLMTQNETTERGTFARVVPGSIKVESAGSAPAPYFSF